MDDLSIMDIPSRKVLGLLIDKERIKDTPESLKLALAHVGRCKGSTSGCEGCKTGWLEVYRKLQVSWKQVGEEIRKEVLQLMPLSLYRIGSKDVADIDDLRYVHRLFFILPYVGAHPK